MQRDGVGGRRQGQAGWRHGEDRADPQVFLSKQRVGLCQIAQNLKLAQSGQQTKSFSVYKKKNLLYGPKQDGAENGKMTTAEIRMGVQQAESHLCHVGLIFHACGRRL